MQVIIDNNIFYTNNIVVQSADVFLDGLRTPQNKSKILISKLNNEIDLLFLAKQLKIIKNNLKCKNINLIIEDSSFGMHVEIQYHEENAIKADIFISYDFISIISEQEIIIFCCHELGHLIDSDNLLSNQKIINKIDRIFKFFILSTIIFLYFKLFFLISLKILFLIIVLTLSLWLSNILKKILTAFLKRNSEYKADALAVSLFGELDPVINALQFLKQFEQSSNESKIFGSHPTIEQRITALKRRFWYKILLKKIWF